MSRSVSLPAPVTARPDQPYIRLRDLEHDLAARVDGEVRFDPGSRGALEAVGGCCGLAGDFGCTAGHLKVSMACAEQELLPAVRAAGPDTLILADGFSCRTQIEQAGVGRQALHLAEVLAAAQRGENLGAYPERRIGRRPGPPQTLHDRS